VGDVVSLLDRPVYTYAEADRLLHLTPGTAKRWINGYERGGRWYDPVLRERPRETPWVTWGEFTETRLLAEYRAALVPMIKLRPVVAWLRDQLQKRYPLAYGSTFVRPDGRELLVRAQEAAGLEQGLWMVVPSGQGALLTTGALRYQQATHFLEETGPAESIVADAGTPHVLFHPGRREGQPTVDGIRTRTIAELVSAGEPIDFVAATYDLPVDVVEQAVSYEASQRRRAA
jgi:uncharacterized protein (DUF433 family)